MWRDATGSLHFSDGSYFKDGVLFHADGSYTTSKDGVQTQFDRNGKVIGYARDNKGIIETFNAKGEPTGSSAFSADGRRLCYDEGQEKRCLIFGPDRMFEVDSSGRLLKEHRAKEKLR
jgi:hypothetical protein